MKVKNPRIGNHTSPTRIWKILGRRLAYKRIHMHLTQRQLAKILKINRKVIERFEVGKQIKMNSFCIILKFFDTLELWDKFLDVNVKNTREVFYQDEAQRKRVRGLSEGIKPRPIQPRWWVF